MVGWTPRKPPGTGRNRRLQAAAHILLAEGRPGSRPQWLLLGIIPREQQLWTQLWRLPQAVEWERAQLFHEVALYVRIFSRAESSNIPAAVEAWQWADRFRLNSAAMTKFCWSIAEPIIPAESLPISHRSQRLAAVDSEDAGA